MSMPFHQVESEWTVFGETDYNSIEASQWGQSYIFVERNRWKIRRTRRNGRKSSATLPIENSLNLYAIVCSSAHVQRLIERIDKNIIVYWKFRRQNKQETANKIYDKSIWRDIQNFAAFSKRHWWIWCSVRLLVTVCLVHWLSRLFKMPNTIRWPISDAFAHIECDVGLNTIVCLSCGCCFPPRLCSSSNRMVAMATKTTKHSYQLVMTVIRRALTHNCLTETNRNGGVHNESLQTYWKDWWRCSWDCFEGGGFVFG